MPSSTGTVLRTTRDIVNYYGLWTGEQFATRDGRLDLSAAIYRAVTGQTPNCFLNDEDMALLLIETNPVVMEAIRMVSAVLPTQPCTTEVDPGYEVPDYVEHVSNWASTASVFAQQPPTVSEVLGLLARAADTADNLATRLPNAA
ncbi:hypothetical protein TPA0910_86990 [Streptomyces hygroscopicus subsp. sporocinereus]|uniref:Uncharacterized protein n=1 Tax=Streptomyces hygroscopicus TaxID=1912 RepID=A0ABQ3UG99_STRHY|nr:hypothetical protein [Streptomyces hygroscopicus]GHJ34266.1 hypothetical protein TPA0910_86990 [Streptomyces hygroscopicus]